MSFSVINQSFLFWVGVQNFLFWQLGYLAQKAHPTNTFKLGVSANFFWEKHMRHETTIFGPKNKIQKFQLSFFCLFSCSFNNKTHLLKPLFL